jgi:hypothetical protein
MHTPSTQTPALTRTCVNQQSAFLFCMDKVEANHAAFRFSSFEGSGEVNGEEQDIILDPRNYIDSTLLASDDENVDANSISSVALEEGESQAKHHIYEKEQSIRFPMFSKGSVHDPYSQYIHFCLYCF